MSIDVVYACGSEMVHLRSGASVRVFKGQHWPASDPVVLARPNLFTDDPRYGLLYTQAPPGYDLELNEVPVVESASAAPGEQRNVRRRPRKTEIQPDGEWTDVSEFREAAQF